MVHIFGDKDIFAIEFNLYEFSVPYGSVIVWHEGLELGTRFGGGEMLGYFNSVLKDLENKDFLFRHFEKFKDSNLTGKKFWDSFYHSRYKLSGSETFDEYSSIVFFDKKSYIVYWRKEHDTFKPNLGVNKNVTYRFEIEASYFENVIKRAIVLLDSLYPIWESLKKSLPTAGT